MLSYIFIFTCICMYVLLARACVPHECHNYKDEKRASGPLIGGPQPSWVLRVELVSVVIAAGKEGCAALGVTTAEQECCVLSRLKLITEDLVAREGAFVHFPFIRNLLNNFTNFKTPHSPFEFILPRSSLDCREDIMPGAFVHKCSPVFL